MLQFDSSITGKTCVYGDIKEKFALEGFELGGNWDYDGGYFDSLLSEENGEYYYVRIPVVVLSGHLDDNDATLRFETPFVVKHVVQTELGDGSTPSPMTNATGVSALLNQFQPPVDTDGNIEQPDKWIQKAKSAVDRLLAYL